MNGIIVKGIGGIYYVLSEEKIYECKARGKFRYNGLTPLIGDNVEFSREKDTWVIEKILKRQSELIRPNVANVTQVFIISAIKDPDINFETLNKFILIAEINRLKVNICINKIDLIDGADGGYKDIFSKSGYNYIEMSAKMHIGIDRIKKELKDNISVFCGPSGVGKSTILNTLIGRNAAEIGDLSSKLHRGKNTTRHSEIFKVCDGLVIDTPGFTSLKLPRIKPEDLQSYMPEFQDYIGMCRFNGCYHYKEPNCAVKRAVEKNEIDKKRYEFYIKTLELLKSEENYK